MPPPQGTWNPLEGPGDYTTTSKVHNDTYDAISPSEADYSGKTVFINGASRGLGKEMALSFAKAGASNIVISARSDGSGGGCEESSYCRWTYRAGRLGPQG